MLLKFVAGGVKSKALKVLYYSKSVLVDINIEEKVRCKDLRLWLLILFAIWYTCEAECHMRDCLHTICLWANLCGILLIVKWCGKVQTMGLCQTWPGISRTRKLAEHEPGRKQYAVFFQHFCFRSFLWFSVLCSCPEFSQWWTITCKCK